MFYADVDGDTFGDPESTMMGCIAPEGYVADNTDCDDADGANFPGNPEVCGGLHRRQCVGDGDADFGGVQEREIVFGIAEGDRVVLRKAQFVKPHKKARALGNPCRDAHELRAIADQVRIEATLGEDDLDVYKRQIQDTTAAIKPTKRAGRTPTVSIREVAS